jgi:hypothetical protein
MLDGKMEIGKGNGSKNRDWSLPWTKNERLLARNYGLMYSIMSLSNLEVCNSLTNRECRVAPLLAMTAYKTVDFRSS